MQKATHAFPTDRDRCGLAQEEKNSGQILIPTLPCAAPLSEVVLFAFDDRAFPFQTQVQAHLFPGRNPQFVLQHGPENSHDEVLLYYGTVIRIGDTFHMWYNGNYGPTTFGHMCYERENCCICYATSKDGVNWEKPELGLVEFNGSKKNNIVDFPVPELWSTCAVLYDPEDPDENRRFKMAYETKGARSNRRRKRNGLREERTVLPSARMDYDGNRWKK